jgi:CheY-like chemotaxis protein
MDVLLVDDDDLIRGSLLVILGAMGHRTTAAASGEDALAVLAEGLRPDAVILDMNMPGMGGAATLTRLRQTHPALPVLVSTGRADQGVLDLVAAHPHTRLLEKPFQMVDLRHALDAIVARRPAPTA